MKTALVHYWLVNQRGGEAVLEAIGELLPQADLYAHVINPATLYGSLVGRRSHETFIGSLPFSRRKHQLYLLLMQMALENLALDEYDLIVSSEAGPAKYVIPKPEAYHICYCHSPMRYLWDQREQYLGKIPQPFRIVAQILAGRLRRSDVMSATRVDQFVANSEFVKKRIWRYYRREAEVIYPPVNLDSFAPVDSPDDYYLVAGELRSYKRVDLAIQACNKLGRRLVVIGSGPDAALKKMAGPTVEFLGRVSDSVFREKLANCRALLFPGVEDFGIVPVEAMASGRPVIAFARGGALESVEDGVSGLFFDEPTVESLVRSMEIFESEEASFKSSNCVARAQRFSRQRFLDRFDALLASSVAGYASRTMKNPFMVRSVLQYDGARSLVSPAVLDGPPLGAPAPLFGSAVPGAE